MKKINLLVVIVLLFTSCQKETKIQSNSDNALSVNQVPPSVSANNKPSKLTICHTSGNGTWKSIIITENDLPGHLPHGDVVPDADGDGYTKVNPCGEGSQNDCDDTNAAINPDAPEVCANGIDDNCNGQIDEEGCVIAICNQFWMPINLDVDHYRNGDPIPQVTDPEVWGTLTTGAWCYYNNDPANGVVYGKLYNWYAVNDPRGLAPAGWHIPTEAEMIAMSDCLGGQEVAGGKLKETGTSHWLSPNIATNETGFTGLPGGEFVKTFNGPWTFLAQGIFGTFWGSTTVTITPDITYAHYFQLAFFDDYFFGPNLEPFNSGFSVRCVKD